MFILKRWTQIGTRTGRARSPVFPGPPRCASPWPSSRTRACRTPRTSPPAVRRRAAADLQTASSSPSKKGPPGGFSFGELRVGWALVAWGARARGSSISSPSDCRRSHFGCQRQFWPIGVSRRPRGGCPYLAGWSRLPDLSRAAATRPKMSASALARALTDPPTVASPAYRAALDSQGQLDFLVRIRCEDSFPEGRSAPWSAFGQGAQGDLRVRTAV